MPISISDELAQIAAQGSRLDFAGSKIAVPVLGGPTLGSPKNPQPTTITIDPGSYQGLTGSALARRVAVDVLVRRIWNPQSSGDLAAAKALAEKIVDQLPDAVLTTTGIMAVDLQPLLANVKTDALAFDVRDRAGQIRDLAVGRLQTDRDAQLRATGEGLGKSGQALDDYVAANRTPASNVVGATPSAANALVAASQAPAAGAVAQDGTPIVPVDPAAAATSTFTPSAGDNSFITSESGVTDATAQTLDPSKLPAVYSEEQMRNMFSTNDLDFAGVRRNEDAKAYYNALLTQAGPGTGYQLQPGQPMVDTGYGDPRGFGVGTSGFGDNTQQSRMGLLDAAQEIMLRTPDEIAAMQKRMEDAGYLQPGSYTIGTWAGPNNSTLPAWQKLVMDAWASKTPITTVLVNGMRATEQTKAAAQAQAAAQATYRITDPREVLSTANTVAQTLIGRDLTDAEAKLIQDQIAQEEIAAQKASAQPGTYSSPNIEASVTDWLNRYRPQQVGFEQAFQQDQTIAKLRGQKPAYVDRKWSNLQWLDFANHLRESNWSEGQVFKALTGTPFEEVTAMGGRAGQG